MKEVKQVTKVYTLRHFGGATFDVNWCGKTLRLEFIAGRGAVGSKRSVLTVTDRFTQDAIEHDPRFGKLIQLDSVYGEAEEGTATVEQPVVQTVVRYTRKQLEAMKAKEEETNGNTLGTVATSGEAEGTVETSGDTLGTVVEKKPIRRKGVKTADNIQQTEVESVKSLNDAYDYFAEIGMVVESEKELEKAIQEKGVSFPNLKK